MGRPYGGCGQLLPLVPRTSRRRLPARASIAVGLAAALVCGSGGIASAAPPLERFLGAAAQYVAISDEARAAIVDSCGPSDLACAAAVIAAHIGPPARLDLVRHPNTDEIRRVTSRPSVSHVGREASGALRVALDRFGRKAERELLGAVTGQSAGAVDRLIIDLRANKGGDFDRMRRVAALFMGPRAGVLRLTDRAGVRAVATPAPLGRIDVAELEVWVGGQTESSAEILAALLRRHAGAQIRGGRTRGKDYLMRVIPVDHDWRLLIPAERIEVPGESISGGLMPDIIDVALSGETPRRAIAEE